ncbi:conserved hypothetical protein [Culex quinquefasciatus]|uniref:Uncharacterized protein n=1 Tax=Culex quinquefasciatus TaxID=7176 RepID=B0XAA9_CULQU|nr:conserved hypothetical protein [Culex quinquefasciatus]|eukprot:XP_001866581.1 conserved hypothetical protein [Culex quinquefasciatus]
MSLENSPPGGGPGTYATNRTINVSAFVAPEGNATFFETNPPGGGPGTYATNSTINVSAFVAPEGNATFFETNPPGGGPGTYATRRTINMSAFAAPEENAMSLENSPPGGGPGTYATRRTINMSAFAAPEENAMFLENNPPGGGPGTYATNSTINVRAFVAPDENAISLENNPTGGGPGKTKGQSWLNGFMRRHPSIAIRTPEGVSAASARVSENDLRGWYRSVLAYGGLHPEILEALKDPTRKINGDEIGFYMYKLAKKVLAKKGSRDVMLVETGDPKKNKTVLFCFSADGFCFPPDIILPYNRLPTDVIQSVPGPWGIGKSDNGPTSKRFIVRSKRRRTSVGEQPERQQRGKHQLRAIPGPKLSESPQTSVGEHPNDSSMASYSFALSDQGFPSADEHPSASSPNDSGSSTGQLREILGDDTQIEIELFELTDGLPCDSALPLQEVTNKRRVSITDFLQTPPTPKRKSKHINYKIKANPVLKGS